MSMPRAPAHRARVRCGIASAWLALAMISGCSDQTGKIEAREIAADTTCSLDGMLLADYPGPKGQIQYDAGPPDFFCDTMEMIAIYLRPEQRKRALAVFTQDMARADWKEPQRKLDRRQDRVLRSWQQ